VLLFGLAIIDANLEEKIVVYSLLSTLMYREVPILTLFTNRFFCPCSTILVLEIEGTSSSKAEVLV